MQVGSIEVRSVDRCVASCAGAICLETHSAVGHIICDWIYVALQAQKALLTAYQQHAIDAAVRRVASDAAFDLRCRMFENKRSAFFHVALSASLRTVAHEFGAVGCAVRIVAVRAVHGAFGNAMVCGKGELRLDVSMASVTQFWLWFDELAIGEPMGLFRKLRHVKKLPCAVPMRSALGFPADSTRCMEWQLLQSTPCWICEECVKSF